MLCRTKQDNLPSMLRLDGRSRRLRQVVSGFVRLACATASVLGLGCSAFIGANLPLFGSQYDLVGRMRIHAEDSILRVDFRVAYTEQGTELHVWGPIGVRRTKVMFGYDGYTIEDRDGDMIPLQRSALPIEVPPSVWQIGSQLGPWLRLHPYGANKDKVLEAWSLNGVSVKVDAIQSVDDETVCKRLTMTSGDVEILVLCDRWRMHEN